jgi:hypothetical protein
MARSVLDLVYRLFIDRQNYFTCRLILSFDSRLKPAVKLAQGNCRTNSKLVPGHCRSYRLATGIITYRSLTVYF